MLLLKVFALLLVLSLAYGNLLEDMDEEKAEQMFVCLSTIVCKERKCLEIKRMRSKAGPELQALFMSWIREIYMVDAEDNDEFWYAYSDIICPKPVEERRNFVKEMAMRGAMFYEEKCKNPEDEECQGTNLAMAEMEKVMAEYTINGVCYNLTNSLPEPPKEMPKKMPEFG